jgi:hypothetical protein
VYHQTASGKKVKGRLGKSACKTTLAVSREASLPEMKPALLPSEYSPKFYACIRARFNLKNTNFERKIKKSLHVGTYLLYSGTIDILP